MTGSLPSPFRAVSKKAMFIVKYDATENKQ